MSAYYDALMAVKDMALASQTEYDRIFVGALPDPDSMCMVPSAGAIEDTTLDLHGVWNLDVVLNAKHRLQANVINALADVHQALSHTTNLPRGDGWQVLAVFTSSAPTFIEHDGDQWLYGSGLQVHIAID